MTIRTLATACTLALATLAGPLAHAGAPKVFSSSLVVNVQGATGIVQRNSAVREMSLTRKGADWSMWLYGAELPKLDPKSAAKPVSPVCIVTGSREEVMALFQRVSEVVKSGTTQFVCAGTLNQWGHNVINGAESTFSIMLRP